MSGSPSISILIRTYNSAHTLGELLARMPVKPGDEIIVVDSGSTDSTLVIASAYHAKIIKSLPPFNYSRTLNEGFQLASCPWVLVISSHCIPTHDSLLDRMREVASCAESDLAVAYGTTALRGSVKQIPPQVDFGGISEWNNGHFRNGGNALALYRRSLWEQHVFDEELITSEDLAWFLWAVEKGHKAAVVRDAVGFYRNQGSLSHMFRKGWHETHLATSLLGARIPKRTRVKKILLFLLNLAHLGKMYVQREIPFRTFIRQVSHGCGTFLAGLFPRTAVDGTPR